MRPREHPELPYIGLEHIESESMRLVGNSDASQIRSSSILFEKGDVLYAKMRPYLNKVWVAEFVGVCSAEFLVFPNTKELNSAFLALRLNADDFVDFANQQVSGERPRVDFESLKSFLILLPPLAEQERIVATVKESFTRMRASASACNRGSERLGKYRTVVLRAAVTGELTHEWRKTHSPDMTGAQLLEHLLKVRRDRWQEAELRRFSKSGKAPKDDAWKSRYLEATVPDAKTLPPLPPGWTWAAWDQVGFSQNGRPFPSKEYITKGIKLLRPGNLFPDGSVQWTEKNTRYLAAKWERLNPDYIIRGNELVINLTAQSLKDDFLGRVCLTSKSEHCLLNQRLARLTPVVGVSTYFLCIFKSPLFRRFVDGLNSGSLIQHMFTSQLGDFALPFPPVPEQIRIADEVQRRLVAADRLATTLSRQSDRARAARQSLLHQAFAGRLIPQDPKNEHSSILLSRIRAAREVETKQPKAERMAKSKRNRRPLIEVLRLQKKPMTPEQLFREAGFQPAEADLFYRELVSLRKILSEKKPSASLAKTWPHRAHVLLQLNED